MTSLYFDVVQDSGMPKVHVLLSWCLYISVYIVLLGAIAHLMCEVREIGLTLIVISLKCRLN